MYMMIIEKNNLKKLIMSAKIFRNKTKKRGKKYYEKNEEID